FMPAENQAEQDSGNTSKAQEESHDAYASISSQDIEYRGNVVEFMWSPESHPIAALVHIDSIDDGRNFSPITNTYVHPQTIGKMTVLEVYKGDIKPWQHLNYSRFGGIVTSEEFYEAIVNTKVETAVYKPGEPKPTKKYIQIKNYDDIDIEVGKNYLAFLDRQTSKDGAYT